LHFRNTQRFGTVAPGNRWCKSRCAQILLSQTGTQGKLPWVYGGGGRQQYRLLEHVAKFADVTWPAIADQQGFSFRGKAQPGFAVALAVLRQEVPGAAAGCRRRAGRVAAP